MSRSITVSLLLAVALGLVAVLWRPVPAPTERGETKSEAPLLPLDVRVLDEHDAPRVGVRVLAQCLAAGAPLEGPFAGFAGVLDLAREAGKWQVGSGERAPTLEALTAADGTVTLRVPGGFAYMVRAEPAAPLVSMGVACLVDSILPPLAVELRVVPGAPLRGRVLDAEGQGADAVVTATWHEGSVTCESTPVRAATGSGAFRFAALPRGPLELQVRIPGRSGGVAARVVAGRVVAGRVAVPPTEEVVLRLRPAATLLAGSVRDTQGRPVAGAHVGVLLWEAHDPDAPDADLQEVAYFARTDAVGAWSVSGWFGGPVNRIEALAPGYLRTAEHPFGPWNSLVLDRKVPSRMDLVLVRGGVLEGRVVEEGSLRPLPGVEVVAHALEVDPRTSRPPPRAARTDASGRYRLEGLAVGRSILRVGHPTHHHADQTALRRGDLPRFSTKGFASAPPPALCVFVAQEGAEVVHELRLQPGVPVAGRVLDDAEEPVAGAQVFVIGPELGAHAWAQHLAVPKERWLATTDAEGRFHVPGLAPGVPWTLVARGPPAIGETQTVTLDPTRPHAEVVLRLRPGATLTGRVLDHDGSGLADASVSVEPHGALAALQTATTHTRSDGSYRLQGVATRAPLSMTVEHGRRAGGRQVEPQEPGAVRQDVSVQLPAPWHPQPRQRVRLVDAEGRPAANQLVIVQHAHRSWQDRTDARGELQIEDMPGPVTILSGLGTHDQRVELGTITLPVPEVPTLLWRPPLAATIEGLVTDGTGAPIPLAGARAWPGKREKGISDERRDQGDVVNGWFRLRVHGPPPYEVEVWGPRDGLGRRRGDRGASLVIPEMPTAPVRIVLPPGGEVRGRVVDDAGVGVPGAMVWGVGAGQLTDVEGRFHVQGLDHDTFLLQVHEPDGFLPVAPTTVQVGDLAVVVRVHRR